MEAPSKSYLAPSAAIFAILAVAFSGFGGLMTEERSRTLFAAGAGFWLLMLIVPWIFFSAREQSQLARSAMAAAFGALAGTCYSLCFAPGAGWLALFNHSAVGAALGFVSYWVSLIRRGTLWRDY